jgi:hypothetical protein
MTRLILLLAAAFLLPFVVHACVTLVRGRGLRPLPTAWRGKLWLVAIGLLFSLMGRAPHALGDIYIPAHMEGNVLVPGRFLKEE